MIKNNDVLEIVCKKLRYGFQNKELLEQALTRKSAYQEKGIVINPDHNNRLEFLGDSILRSVIDDCLMEQHPEYGEDQLSINRDQLVSKDGKLFNVAEQLMLDSFIQLGKGEKISIYGSGRRKILTDVMEAIIGAMFIDCGRDYSIIKWFIGEHFSFDIQHHKDQCLFDAVEECNLNKIKFWLNKEANPKEKKVLKKTVGLPAVVCNSLKFEEEKMSYMVFPAAGIGNIKCSSLELAILYSSLNRNTVEIVCTLLEYKADPNNIGSFECSLLQQIVSYDSQFPLKKELETIDARDLSEVVNSFIEQNPTYVVSCSGYGKMNPASEENKITYCDLKDKKDERYERVANWYAISFKEEVVNGTTKVIVYRGKDDTSYSKKILNEILVWICEYGADLNLFQDNLIKSGNWASIKYFTPLYLAVMQGDSEKVKILLQYNADPNLKSYNGKTPLHEAVSRCSEKNEALFVDIAKQLLEADAEPITEITPDLRLKTKVLTYLAEARSNLIQGNQDLDNTSNQLSDDISSKEKPLLTRNYCCLT